MGKIYIGQTDLTINIKTNKNLTGATAIKLKVQDPNGVESELDVNIVDAINGMVKFVVLNSNTFTKVGRYTFWLKTTDAQGKISIGEPDCIHMYKQGN